MKILACYERAGGTFEVTLLERDGAEPISYGVNPALDDPAPLHVMLKGMLAAGQIQPTGTDPAELDAIRDFLQHCVDKEAARRVPTTAPAALQAQNAKLEEARTVIDMIEHDGEAEVLSLPSSDLQKMFPTLLASAEVEGISIVQAAQLVHDRAMSARQYLFSLERARLAGKRAIREAGTALAAEQAFAGISWPER